MGSEVGAAVGVWWARPVHLLACGLSVWWPVGVWCLSFLSERFSRKCVDEWRGLCSLITSEATTAERNTQTHKHMNSSDRYNHYKQSVSLCEALWEQMMRDDAFECLGREGWDFLREAYDKAREEQNRRFHAWLDGIPEKREENTALTLRGQTLTTAGRWV